MAVVPLARRHLATDGGKGAVVVGVGQNAHAGLVLAAGGGCRAVAIVDGLHGPFRSSEDEVGAMYATIRAIADDPLATSEAPPRGLDPRASYGYGVSVSEAFLRRFWGAVDVPVLAVETPASPTPPSERAERASWFGGPVELVELGDGSPVQILAAVLSWPAGAGRPWPAGPS
jgi:hypothetical protein